MGEHRLSDRRRTPRAALFAEFKAKIGLKAHSIADAPSPTVIDIARRGALASAVAAARLVEIGRLAVAECDGELARALRTLPLAKARALLKKFPSIATPARTGSCSPPVSRRARG